MKYSKYKLERATPLELPTDYPFASAWGIRGTSFQFDVGAELSAQVRALSLQQGTTIFITLLATLKILLYRYSGQHNIRVAIPIPGRMQKELERLMGFFNNTVVIKTELNSEAGFIKLLEQVKTTIVEVDDNEKAPIEEIVNLVLRERDQTGNPLFQIMFVLQNTPDVQALRLEKLTLSMQGHEHTSTQFDTRFTINERGDNLQVLVEYSTSLCNESTIVQMANHFKMLLGSIVKAPNQMIGSLPMLTSDEGQKLLYEFNDTVVDYSKEKTIVDMFEEQAAKTPQLIAVAFEEEPLSYQKLNEKANQLAGELLSLGIGRNQPVPVIMAEGIDYLVSFIAILKTGAACVPLGVDWPVERIESVLKELNPSLIFLNEESTFIKDSLEKKYNFKTVNYRELNAISVDVNNSLPDLIMCIFYTSGSTGVPKGVEINHRGIANRFFWMNDYFNFPTKNVLKTTRNIFDSSIWQLFWPLINGGRTVLGVERDSYDLDNIFKLIDVHKITTIDFSPALFQLFVDDISKNKLTYNIHSLKDIIIGGEAINVNDVNKFRKHFPDIRLTNLYGPTEASIGCVYFTINKDHYTEIPIGIPIANTQIYILDNNLQMVPIEVTGEIHIAGVCLANGYFNRPELTAQKFIADSFSNKAGARMYRTGDLGRWLPDGNIEYLGRKDDQVKIRGYRIEPGEVENVLRRSDLVKQAVVLAREDSSGNKRLVCYVVMSQQQAFNREAIESYLRSKLPDYMVPSLFVELEDMPLTSSGKIDRKSLPDTVNRFLANQFVAPCNEMEVRLVAIWQNLLGIEKTGTNDNFFHLGGHSLLAMRVVSAMRKELGVELSIKDLFLYPTISELVAHLQKHDTRILLPVISRQPRRQHIELSYSQEGFWFMDQLEGSIHYHLPIVLRFSGSLNRGALRFAFQNVINRHEVLRTVIKDEDGTGYLYIQDDIEFQLHIVDGAKYRQDKEGVKLYLQTAVNKPFDLSRDVMLRAELIDLSNQEYILVITMHHIASDGWSFPIILKELLELYSSYDEGRPSTLLPLNIQYADYAIWQRQFLQGEMLDKNLAYWRKKLEGVSLLELPTDYRRSSIRNTKGAIARFIIPKGQVEQLELLSNQQATTLFMTVFAAFSILLHRYSNQNDVCVGGVIAGRQHQELEDLIGLFVNTLALRIEVNSHTSFTDLLKQVRSVSLEAYEHQEVPFKKVVEIVAKERELNRNPLFQVMFVWHNTPEIPELQMGEIKLTREIFESGTAKFDITFEITETISGLEGAVEYRSDLYHQSSIERMIGHFKELLSSILKAPQENIGKLRMLTMAEEQQMIDQFNQKPVKYPTNINIVDLFEKQAAKTPYSVAVLFEGEQITYAELNERTNQLAHYLRSKNVRTETLVPICIERSLDMIIGILAILKAGGAYVPIDPAYPQERIRYMLEDTRASIVVTSYKSRSKLPTSVVDEIIEIEKDLPAVITQPLVNPQAEVRPNNIAYVIYTSGSTGNPKGVMIEHKSLAASTLYRNEYYENFGSAFLIPSFAFDSSVAVLFGTLTTGGKLILCNDQEIKDPSIVKQLLSQSDTILCVPSFYRFLLEEDLLQSPSLSKVILAGEKLDTQQVFEHYKRTKNVQLYNEYGPTEATVWSTVASIDPGNHLVAIGKPIGTVSAYILDNELQLVPVGVIGELCIGGVQVARGYLNLPELTSSRFMNDPFSKKEGSRIYRTGDQCRWLADGRIEYIGRVDDQVKIRGYRIELGEIESILRQCDLVKQGVVLSKEDIQGHKTLVGYVVAEKLFNREAITAYLKSRLPEYMVPSQLIELENLPLTANGKIDKKALPDPDITNLIDSQYVAPRNETERIITQIWEEVLKVEKVGIHDNFFQLGGHSLLILKMVSRIRKMGVQIEAKDFFGYQTIERQSNFIKTTLKLFNAANEGNFVIPIQTEGTNIPMFAFPEFLLYSEIGKHLNKTQPFYSIEQSPCKTAAEIADHYISEIKKIYPKGPYFLAGYCDWGKVAVEMAHKLIAQGDEVPALVLIEYYSPTIEISRLSEKFIRNKLKFIIAKLKEKSSFFDIGKLLLEQSGYALKYIYKKISGRSRKNETDVKPFPGKVLLFQATETYSYKNDSHMGWKDVLTGDVKKFVIGGQHLNIMVNPVSAAHIAEILNDFLINPQAKVAQVKSGHSKKDTAKELLPSTMAQDL